jgi:hypothetical protein
VTPGSTASAKLGASVEVIMQGADSWRNLNQRKRILMPVGYLNVMLAAITLQAAAEIHDLCHMDRHESLT